MTGTLALLDKALERQSASEWARVIGVHRNAFTVAKAQGYLSPVLAGNLAIELGEDPHAWMAQAVIEGEKASPAKERLAKRLEGWRKR